MREKNWNLTHHDFDKLWWHERKNYMEMISSEAELPHCTLFPGQWWYQLRFSTTSIKNKLRMFWMIKLYAWNSQVNIRTVPNMSRQLLLSVYHRVSPTQSPLFILILKTRFDVKHCLVLWMFLLSIEYILSRYIWYFCVLFFPFKNKSQLPV